MLRNKLGTALKEMHESLGNQGTIETFREMLKDGTISLNDYSLKEAWDAFERDENGNVRAYSEAVSSDMFPTLNGEIITGAIMSAYQIPTLIGDRLCMTERTTHEIHRIGGFGSVEMPDQVLQGVNYNDSGISEKYATIEPKKFGRLITVTEEAIYFDQTGQLLNRCRGIGRKAALYRERLIVEGVQDINGTVYKPSGVAEAFYGVTRTRNAQAAYNLVESNAFGESGLSAVNNLAEEMVDENGDPIFIDPANTLLLYPKDLEVQVLQMARTVKVPEGNENAMNIYAGSFVPVTSPYISRQSATTWYWGMFNEDFIWSEVWPLQIFTAIPGNIREFMADIKSMHKVRFYGEIGARDFCHSFKCTA